MYLLVFITLMISMIGLYTQVAALQAARFASSQTTLATTMLAWHATAVAQANYALDQTVTSPNFPAAGGGCYMTLANPGIGSSASSNPCKDTAGKTVTVPGGTADAAAPYSFIGTGTSTLTLCSKTTPTPMTPPCLSTLPPSYQVNPYTFYSVAFKVAGPPVNIYVMTYVVPPTISATNPAPGFIILPPPFPLSTSHQIGFSIGDLYHQLQVSQVPTLSYGTVSSNTVVTLANSGGTPSSTIQYPLPTAWAYNASTGVGVPPGSVAIISSATTPPCPIPDIYDKTQGMCCNPVTHTCP